MTADALSVDCGINPLFAIGKEMLDEIFGDLSWIIR